ncbi:hypothetical protein KBC03_03495 [Patescibacteria group bacterium]|nr:hypothetical protein [Patescibacteria group bacterium]
MNNIVNSGLPEVLQYSASPVSTLPVYETNLTSDTIAYEPVRLLDSTTPVTIYKQYQKRNNETLKNGDQIDVAITIQSNQATTITYLDEIRGPWELKQNDDGSIDTWNR